MDISNKELIITSIDEFMHKKLNKITEATLKATDQGLNLKKFDTLEEMFEDLEI